MALISEFLPNANGYADLDVDSDTKAFINPTLVYELANDYQLPNAANQIDNFFDYILNTQNIPIEEIANVHEIPYTHLGYNADGITGNGPKQEQTELLINQLHNLLNTFPVVDQLSNSGKKLQSVSLFMKNFSFDSISDLTTQIISNDLYDFTMRTVQNSEYANFITDVPPYDPIQLTYWNNTHWEIRNITHGLYLNAKFTLLVPSNMVEDKKFSKNPGNFITQIIIPRLKDLPENNRRTNKEIRDAAINEAGSEKDLISNDMHDNPEGFLNYFN